jgi:hypothetical protein
VAGREVFKRPYDPKVAETRLAVLGNQDVVLGVPSINVRAHSFPRFAYRSNSTMQNLQPVEMHEALAHLCKLLLA